MRIRTVTRLCVLRCTGLAEGVRPTITAVYALLTEHCRRVIADLIPATRFSANCRGMYSYMCHAEHESRRASTVTVQTIWYCFGSDSLQLVRRPTSKISFKRLCEPICVSVATREIQSMAQTEGAAKAIDLSLMNPNVCADHATSICGHNHLRPQLLR